MYPNPDIIHFEIGTFTVALHWYSMMIVLGVLAATYIALHEARRRGQSPEHIWQLLPFMLIVGIIGARVGWAVVSTKELAAKGWEHVFNIPEGGISIQGALVGGIIVAVIYTWKKKLDFFEWSDIIIPGVALAQAIGRWGNYFNQELFGAPCDQPWCIPISNDILASHPNYVQYLGKYTHFAPTFAYEMIWDLLNFALLMWLGRQARLELRTGDLLWVYGIFYSVGRFFIEEVRVDGATVGGIKAPEIFAILTIVVCWAGLIWRHRPSSPAPVAVVADEGGYLDEEWEDAEAGAYAVAYDEEGDPVEPVPHSVPVVAQSESET